MKKILLALSAAVMLALGACQKAPQITMTTPASVEMSADGSSGSITFTANRDWTISCSESWIHVNPSSGEKSKDAVTVTVRCDANTTYDDRTATVTIRAEDAAQTVTIKQSQNLGVIVPTQSFNIKADTKSIEVEVQANTEYSVSVSANWIKQNGTKALTSKTLTFSIEENTTYDDREARITIKSQNSSIAEQVISVKQAAKEGLQVETQQYMIGANGGTIEVAVKANVAFEVKPDAGWIHYTQTKALSSKTIVLTVDKNGGTAGRSGMVRISQKNGTLSSTVTIVQFSIPEGAVDLGLSVFWASCNLGATKPEEYGNYYAWGEVKTKSQYSWSTYKWCNGNFDELTKYCLANTERYWDGTGAPDGKTVLDPEDDAAHVILGGSWRMPTDEEWTELRTQCVWTWTELNGVKGYVVKSKSNGNSLFLPAAGCREETNLNNAGSYGRYWSSSLYTSYPVSACIVTFRSDGVYGGGYYNRRYGLSVRPVTE